jgi:hypothetical protein
MPDPERAIEYTVRFLAAFVMARAAWRMAGHAIAAWRERRAILAIAAELEAERPPPLVMHVRGYGPWPLPCAQCKRLFGHCVCP